ncbi:GntR family transcriptional regulator [Paenibacillus antri]|nr:GntR family transcriptional regulator [Paenibacillus antri]
MSGKISRVNLTDEIYRMIKEDILSNRLKSGEKVNIDQLARTLEVSNIPIREALSRLQSEGYLHVVPFKGMFVNGMSEQDLNELFEIRLALEPLAAEKASPRIPDEALARLERFMASHRGDLPDAAEGRLKFVAEMNESVHGAILDYCGNANLRVTVRGYIERIERYLGFIRLHLEMDDADVEWREHQSIVERLAARHAAGAADAMRQHIERSRERTNLRFLQTKD